VTLKLSRGLPGVGHFSVITRPFGGSLLLYQNQAGLLFSGRDCFID
jgi:hypothetical protein